MTGRLAGKVALITGTASGQGRAAALLFAAEGATVAGTDIIPDGAAETVALVRATGGRMDSIDILYNNAGAPTKQLAAEGAAHGIRANCISPGMIATPATARDLLADDHPMRTIARAIPLGRIGPPEDVVRCALFLAFDEASYVTGANLAS